MVICSKSVDYFLLFLKKKNNIKLKLLHIASHIALKNKKPL